MITDYFMITEKSNRLQVKLAFLITPEDLHHDLRVNICNFAIFGPIFLKSSPKCKTGIWNIIHHFGKFLLIFQLGRGRYSIQDLA